MELSLGYFGKGHTHTQYISLGRMERDENFARIRYNLTLSRDLTFAGTNGDLTLASTGRGLSFNSTGRDCPFRMGRSLTLAITGKDVTLARAERELASAWREGT
jgi:hypothetical protein